jgi:hypothetical protein
VWRIETRMYSLRLEKQAIVGAERCPGKQAICRPIGASYSGIHWQKKCLLLVNPPSDKALFSTDSAVSALPDTVMFGGTATILFGHCSPNPFFCLLSPPLTEPMKHVFPTSPVPATVLPLTRYSSRSRST